MRRTRQLLLRAASELGLTRSGQLKTVAVCDFIPILVNLSGAGVSVAQVNHIVGKSITTFSCRDSAVSWNHGSASQLRITCWSFIRSSQLTCSADKRDALRANEITPCASSVTVAKAYRSFS